VALVGEGTEFVLGTDLPGAAHCTDEADLLTRLDAALAALAPGVLVTWNGAGFDLPFLAERARRCGVTLGLVLRADERLWARPGPDDDGRVRAVPVRGSWWGHRHLDAFRVYRSDVGRLFGLSCALKSLSRLVGLVPVEVDRTAIHDLDPADLAAYVASDAWLARELACRRWASAAAAVDDPVWVAASA